MALGAEGIYLDAQAGILRVPPNTTIAALVKNLLVEEGYYLEFYDEEGYWIPAEYYEQAQLEDRYAMLLKYGRRIIREYQVSVSPLDDDSLNPLTGAAGISPGQTLAASLAVFSLTALCAVYRRRRSRR